MQCTPLQLSSPYNLCLQCSIPVFDGLLPEPHNGAILRLLFLCAQWHGLAKLRMHIEPTLEILDQTTVRIGSEFRAFAAKTCLKFDTKELRRETEARKHRQSKAGKKSKSDGPLPKTFNLQTYKYHSLGDYANTIRCFGTTDSFSTEPVGLLQVCF